MDTLELSAGEHIGKQLKKARKEGGMTQSQIGESIGCSNVNIHYLENRPTADSLRMVSDYARALGYKSLKISL